VWYVFEEKSGSAKTVYVLRTLTESNMTGTRGWRAKRRVGGDLRYV
jgi:hypothetical protein